MTTLFKASRANPFSKKSSGARIPDGKATFSNAMRVSGVKEMTMNQTGDIVGTAGTQGTSEICLFAGINGCGGLVNGRPGEALDFGLFNHIGFDSLGAATCIPKPATAPVRWRLVSSALKLTLLNNAEENDGWWEAIRIEPNTRDPSQTDPMVFAQPAPPELVGLYCGISSDKVQIPHTRKYNDTWVNHPTYQTGKLRDIHGHMFTLNSVTSEHDFVVVNTGSAGSVTQMFDPSYDMVVIRVHARTVAAGAATRLLAHFVSNQEVIFDEGTILASSATQAPGESAIVPYRHGRRSAPSGNEGGGGKRRKSGPTTMTVPTRRRSLKRKAPRRRRRLSVRRATRRAPVRRRRLY